MLANMDIAKGCRKWGGKQGQQTIDKPRDGRKWGQSGAARPVNATLPSGKLRLRPSAAISSSSDATLSGTINGARFGKGGRNTMEDIMSKLKLALAAIATLGFTTSALAQDATYDTRTETLDATTVDVFTASDANADGALDRAEYKVFVETKAQGGDETSMALAESGDYDLDFMTKDINADGLVDASEAASTVTDMTEKPMTVEEGMIDREG